jgi:putative serine protease PepD
VTLPTEQSTHASAPALTWPVLALTAGIVAVFAGTVGGLVVHAAADHNSAPRTVTLGAATAGAPVAARTPGSVAAVAAKILPSVVSLEVRTGSSGDTGTGIVISKDGYILTNNHVVAAAETGGKLTVVFPDKSSAAGTIVGHPDPVSDLAVVRVRNVKGLRPATLGSSAALSVGDPVVAVGSPLGLAGTVTTGIVSALDRPVAASDTGGGNSDNIIDAIQTDAAINPGNSGGPLVDMSGAVIGVNSAIATLSGDAATGGQGGSIGLGFAIPIDQAKRIASEILKQGYATHAIIGVHLDTAYNGDGARIADPRGTAVTPGGPAARAGLRAGDIVVAADGERITSPEELIVAIRKHAPGDRMVLTYLRGGHRHTTTVVLGSARSG